MWVVVAAVIGAGATYYSLEQQKKAAKKAGTFEMAPEFGESSAARSKWWETLQGQNADNNYGAISPDWADIWEKTKQKVQQFYEGGPTSPGAIQKVYSSTARRGVQDSPAADIMASRLRVQEGQDLGNLASTQAQTRLQFGESARQDWMNNLASISGMQPASQYRAPQYTPGAGEAVAGAANSVGGYFAQQQNNKWLEDFMRRQNRPQYTANITGQGTTQVAPPNYYLR